MTRLVGILILVALLGCANETSRTKAIELGADVTLTPGATASVADAQMTVRFVAVTEDSRCPQDVTCVWAGQVKVQIEIQEPSKAATQVEMLQGGSVIAGAYRVTLVRVEPHPVSTAKIAPQDYRATVKTDKTD